MKKIIVLILIHSSLVHASFGEALGHLFTTLQTNRKLTTQTYQPVANYYTVDNEQQPVEEKYSLKRRLLFCLLCCITPK